MAIPSKVYAAAYFEVAKKKATLDQGLAALNNMVELYVSNPGLQQVLAGHVVETSARVKILNEIMAQLDVDAVTGRILLLLCERGRFALLPEIVREVENLKNLEAGIKSGVLRSAVELSSDEIEKLSKTLSKRVGGKVQFRTEVDPDLLGGFVATVGGKTYDASLRTQMEKIRRELV